MISVTSSKNQRLRAARPNTVLVLEPPRHTRWPLVFLGPGKHMIGTSPDAAIRIDAEGVQPYHALILVGDQKILLKALDPKTWVNDGAASETTLRPGDRISIGPITFQARPATARELEDYQPSETIEDEKPPAAEISNRVTVAAPESVPVPAQLAPLQPEFHAVHDRPEALPVPVVEEEIRSSPETTFQEIHRHLEALNEPIVVPQVAPTRATMEIEARQKAREEQLNQLASDLARQSQRLREQTARIAERELELERKQSAIAEENERLITAAQSTRQELAEEHARQMALWQEWDSAYKRTSEELKQQLQAIEKRRTDLHAESERLGIERLEIQRLQAESETERRHLAAERVQATTEFGDLHAQRTALETERRQLLVSIQEREAALASERRALTVTQDEMLATRQQFEHERTLFATERSAESLRREQEIHEQTVARIRLTDQEADLQAKQLELAAILRKHEEDWVELDRARSLVETERAEIRELQARVCQLESELDSSRQLQHKLQTTLEQAQFESERTKAELDAALRQFESDRTERERSLADSNRSETDELQKRVNQLESELEYSKQSQHDLRIAMDQVQVEAERSKLELEDRQHAFDLQRAQLDALHLRLQEEQEAAAAARAELAAVMEARSRDDDNLVHPTPLASEPSTSVPAAVERLMGIVPERDGLPSLGLPNDDPLPSYFGHGSASQSKKHPSTPSTEMLFSASDLPSEHNPERPDSSDDFGHGLAQLSTQPPRAEPTENSGLHCYFDSDESSLTTDEILASTLLDDVTDDASADVSRTLTEVNEQFGYVSSLLNHYLGPLTQDLPDAGKSTANSETPPNSLTPIEKHDASEMPYRAAEDSVPGLRAQLAEMFDLPENSRDAVESMEQLGFGLDQTCESSQSMDHSRLDEQSSQETLRGEETDIPVGSLLSEFMRTPDNETPSPAQTSQDMQDEEESDDEDPWVKRLRELSQSTEPASPPPAPKAEPESFSNNDDSLVQADDEFSVEAQLARLLGRPYRSAGNAPEKPKSEKSNVEQSTDSAAISNPDLEAALSLQPVDRSHLSEAPKHKTDRSALRDETQSFREVAQISARTALAKHSWNNLKNEFYFISVLTAASSIATAWFLGTFLVGWETDPWKGVTCAIATILCSHRMVKSSAKLNQWHRTNRKNKTKTPQSVSATPPEITKPTK